MFTNHRTTKRMLSFKRRNVLIMKIISDDWVTSAHLLITSSWRARQSFLFRSRNWSLKILCTVLVLVLLLPASYFLLPASCSTDNTRVLYSAKLITMKQPLRSLMFCQVTLTRSGWSDRYLKLEALQGNKYHLQT